MRVFITGASGHVGSALVPELLGAGHEVVGLARSDKSAATLATWGAEVFRGDLDDLDRLQEAASAADGVVHLAFKHEAMLTGNYDDAITADLRAIDAIAEALAGSGKPFVGTSGTLMIAGLGRTGTETDALPSGPRVDAENKVIGLADTNVRSSVVRLPPTVHSELDHFGFIPILISIARNSGTASYVGDGASRWPAGHTLDAAHLYRLALENAPAGTRLHAVGDEGIPFREIAESIGAHLSLPVTSIEPEAAGDHFGFLAPLVTLDDPTSSAITQKLLGWQPMHPGLLADMDKGHYFQ